LVAVKALSGNDIAMGNACAASKILQNTALNALRGSVAFIKEDYYCI
jgi:hypothetical protein